MHSGTIFYTLLLFVSQAFADFDAGKKTNLVIYWGQNSAGHSKPDPLTQGLLIQYCDDESVDIIIIAFVSALVGTGGMLKLNLANALNATEDNIQPFPAPDTGAGIKGCQNKGKAILLSFGGDRATTEQGYKSAQDAEAGAQKVWEMFGPSKDSSIASHERPFGDAVVDGFDFDFEVTDAVLQTRHIDAFVRKLSELAKSTSNSKKFYLSAAPQCINVGSDEILKSVDLDMVFVQFYNNACAATGENGFDAEAWNTWATGKNTCFFTGLPATTSATTLGYIGSSALAEKLKTMKTQSELKGAMLWDASQAWANNNYHLKVKAALG